MLSSTSTFPQPKRPESLPAHLLGLPLAVRAALIPGWPCSSSQQILLQQKRPEQVFVWEAFKVKAGKL